MKLTTIVAFLLLTGCSLAVDMERLHVGSGIIRRAPSERKEDQALIAERLLCAGVAAEQVQAVLRGNGLDATEAAKVTTVALSKAQCPVAR